MNSKEALLKIVAEYPSIPIQEVVAVYGGVKKSLFTGCVGQDKARKFSEIAKELGMTTEIWTGDDSNPEAYMIALAKDKSVAQAIKRYRQENNHRKVGIFLDYPLCCVEKREYPAASREKDDFYKEGRNLELNYRMNTMFNFSSYSSIFIDSLSGKFFQTIARCKHADKYYLIHIPCSIDCLNSLKKAEEVEEAMEKYLPEKNEEIKKSLKKAFIIFGPLNFSYFEYRKDGDVFSVRNPEHTLLVDKYNADSINGASYIKIKQKSVVTDKGKELSTLKTIIFK